MRALSLRSLASAVFGSVAIFASAQTFSIPADEIDITGAKYLKSSKRMLLPSVNVEVMNWGKITSVVSTSALQSLGGAKNSSARSTMEVAVPSNVAMLRGVASELYDDLATKLRAAGWEVLTYDEAKSDPILSGIKQELTDAKLGAPVRKVNLGKQKMNYTIATPPGMPAMDPGMTMPMFGLRSLLKARDTHSLETTYRFDPIAMQGERRHGIGSNTASTSAAANLALAHAQATFVTNKTAFGWVKIKSPIPVAGDVGEIKKAADVSPKVANALSEALSFLGPGGSINASKGLYIAELDEAALKANLLLAGKAFNDEIIKGLGKPQ
ncbi:hypothetical protein [Oleiharenicola lentus]|uniref:hypothetical protein n=1 Tax=Oleiharenicola lentus TaxID=2508720 RepID=UPI003F66251B